MTRDKMLLGALFAVALSWCGLANDAPSYIYWQVDQSSSPWPYSFNLACMVPSGGGDPYVTYKDEAPYVFARGADETGGEGTSTDPIYMNIGSDYAGKSFVIELYSEDNLDTPCAYSPHLSFNDLLSYITPGGVTPGEIQSATLKVSGFSSLPEPTSGVLALLGLAVLGLKRRKNMV